MSNRSMKVTVVVVALLATMGSVLAQTSSQRGAALQARLETEVRHVLVTRPFYTVFDNLAYQVNGDRVTLLGQVVNPALKSDAEKAVKSIEGVAAVDDKVEVLPPSPMDEHIRREVYRAIYSAPGMEKYSIQAVPPIHIVVKNGRVTLVGIVANPTDKLLAETRANSVAGTFAVTDELRVEGKVQPGS